MTSKSFVAIIISGKAKAVKKSSTMLLFRCLLVSTSFVGVSSWMSQGRALFTPARALSAESCRSCTWHECETNGWQFLPRILATTEAAAAPTSSLAMLGESVGKEIFLANARTGKKASLRKAAQPKVMDAFDAMDAGYF